MKTFSRGGHIGPHIADSATRNRPARRSKLTIDALELNLEHFEQLAAET